MCDPALYVQYFFRRGDVRNARTTSEGESNRHPPRHIHTSHPTCTQLLRPRHHQGTASSPSFSRYHATSPAHPRARSPPPIQVSLASSAGQARTRPRPGEWCRAARSVSPVPRVPRTRSLALVCPAAAPTASGCTRHRTHTPSSRRERAAWSAGAPRWPPPQHACAYR